MKNSAIGQQGSHESPQPELTDEWRGLLVIFDRDLRRRGAADKTRRAYGSDIEQFARWATIRGLRPATLEHRDLRRYAAVLSSRGVAPTTAARKLASLRALF